MARVYLSRLEDGVYEPALQEALEWIEGKRIISSGTRVFVKPNFTYPYYKPGVTTSPEFLDALLGVLVTRTHNVILGESDGGYRGWPAELAFRSHRVYEICERHGVELVNLSRIPSELASLDLGSKTVGIELPSLLLREIDVLITAPVPKVHALTIYSGALKNQWGCIPNNMRLRYHPYLNEGIPALNQLLKTRISIADATYMLNKTGPMHGEPVRMDLVIAADSPGALDRVCCELMGLDVAKVKHLEVARRKGFMPRIEEIQLSRSLADLKGKQFELHRTLRNWVTVFAFSRPWAIKLIWDSFFGDMLHKILYSVAGNPVQGDVHKAQREFDMQQ